MKPVRVGGAKVVFRKALSSFIRKFVFFGRNSGIHGLKQIFDKNLFIVSRLFWIVIFLVSSGFLYLLLAPVLELSDQVNFTPETLYLQWVTTFPGVTVCEYYNYKMIQKKLMSLYPDLVGPMNFDYRKHMTDIIYGRGSCGKALCVPCGPVVPCDTNWREIIEKVHRDCTELITDCSFNGQQFPCCQKFRLVDSEYGYCFSFNTLQNENWRDAPLFTVNRSTGPGALSFRLLSDADISVHSPEELATNVLDEKFKFHVRIREANRIQFLFSVVEMENDPMLMVEDIDVRGCRKPEEVPEAPLHTYPIYSYGACRLAEDTEQLFDRCGCIHPVRDISYKKHYCNFTGITCMIETKVQSEKLGVDYQGHYDECLPSCVESELTTIHVSRQWVHEDINQGTLVTVQMAALPTLRFIRNLLRTDLDTVVSVGGIVSLFFAASILSIVEIFYLLIRPQK